MARFKEIAPVVADLILARVLIDDLREQDLNARAMTKERFDQMTKNIKNRGALESLPYCVKTDRGIEIVSGHHRVRAARQAAIAEIPVLLDLKPMSRQEIISKQLAHNALEGVDNEQILGALYSEISDAELKLASGIEPPALDLKAIDIPNIEVGFEWHRIGLLFLPYQMDTFESVITSLSDEEKIMVAPLEHWEQFKTALTAVITKENIKSVGMAVARMSEIVIEHLKEQVP